MFPSCCGTLSALHASWSEWGQPNFSKVSRRPAQVLRLRSSTSSNPSTLISLADHLMAIAEPSQRKKFCFDFGGMFSKNDFWVDWNGIETDPSFSKSIF